MPTHTVYYRDVDHSVRLGSFPSFEAAEEYVLECVDLHAKRRELERKYFPAEEVLEEEYQRIDDCTWKGGLYGYRIAPYTTENAAADSHRDLLKQAASEEWVKSAAALLADEP